MARLLLLYRPMQPTCFSLLSIALSVSVIGLAPETARAQETLTISFNTTTNGSCYDPKNCTVVWVEDSSGQFVKTLGRWANSYRRELVTWWGKVSTPLDAETAASRRTHDDRLTVTWDMRHKDGSVMADGTYKIRFEMTECNNGNNEDLWTYTFNKDGNPLSENSSGGGFENVDVGYTGRTGPLPQAGDLELSTTDESVVENAGGVVLYVIRANGSDGVVGVDYAVTGLSATSGEDFGVGGGTVTFADGDTASKSISIAIVDDATTEPVETFTVTLSTPSGGATLGANDTTTVSIIDDDDPNPIGPGVIEFGQGNYTADEGSGLATVELLRSRGTQGAVSVDINTGDGTALSDLDYASLTETVTFDDGDAGPRVVTIRLVDDTDIELRESFVVTLSQASGGAVIGTIRDAEVQIVDDDAHGTNIALEGRMSCNNAKSAPGVLMAMMIGLMAIRPGRRRRRSGHR